MCIKGFGATGPSFKCQIISLLAGSIGKVISNSSPHCPQLENGFNTLFRGLLWGELLISFCKHESQNLVFSMYSWIEGTVIVVTMETSLFPSVLWLSRLQIKNICGALQILFPLRVAFHPSIFLLLLGFYLPSGLSLDTTYFFHGTNHNFSSLVQ